MIVPDERLAVSRALISSIAARDIRQHEQRSANKEQSPTHLGHNIPITLLRDPSPISSPTDEVAVATQLRSPSSQLPVKCALARENFRSLHLTPFLFPSMTASHK